MAKKKTTEKALNIDNILFNCRDYLRAARNSGSFFEKRDMMLTLVFLRFIGEKYEDGIENLKQTLKEQGLDPEDENIRAAFFDDATFADGTYNLPPEARWSTIISTPAPQLNVALDTALQRLEEEDPQLKGCFVKGTFTARNLAANDIKKIVDEVNKISHKTFGEEKDLIGRVYEYFLKEFAVNATKEEGEFYTPHDVVQLIATMIEPYDGTLYDPCCGSGGMFIQSAELVKSKQGNLNGINVYGQEKEPATYRLAKMNLALRGISHNLGEEADSSFTHDLHKGLHFNYIMANPPFNLKGWYNDNLKNDGRWSDYQTPPESNANYAWILHILSHLKKADGVAGFLLANGALNDNRGTASHLAITIKNEMHNEYILQKIELGNKCAVKEKIKIAIANIKLDTKRCCLGLACGDDVEIDRLRLIDFMYRAYANGKNDKVDFLVFPEFYMPLQWISDVLAFVRKSGITVVSGLQYVTSGHQAYNNVAIFAPVNTGRYTSSVLFAREKNDYAPMERQILALEKYICVDQEKPVYQMINNRGIDYGLFLCYEFTDIIARALYKDKVDIIFTPEHNRDTSYFSNIIETTARDLHVFIVQANTSIYGDSTRIL